MSAMSSHTRPRSSSVTTSRSDARREPRWEAHPASASRSSFSQLRDASPILSPDADEPAPAPPVSRKRYSDHGLPSASSKRRRPNDTVVDSKAARTAGTAGTIGTTEELLKPSIVVRAHPPNPLSKPYMLLPLMLLPREYLPLSCLDLASPTGDLPLSRRFQSHIRIMELEGRLGSNVLLARAPSSAGASIGSSSSAAGTTTTPGFSSVSSIFAIERDASNFYVLCKLGSWVDIRQLAQHATAVCRQRMPSSTQAAANVMEPAIITPQVYKERGRRRLAIAELQSAVRRRPASQIAETAAATDAATTEEDMAGTLLPEKNMPLPTPPASDANKTPPAASAEPPPPPPPPPLEPADPPSADSIFQNIRNQYSEALYHSMGSLAYFAKGPLSRARAAFHLDCDANLEMDDLIQFLKSLVLTTTMIDKKYRETVPEIVACLRTMGGYTSDHGGTAQTRKSKKPKKVKLGSSGLYTDEDVHVRRWWEASKPAPRDDEVFPRPEAVKYTISCLRTRETQLQMILILEILALESMGLTAGENAAGESQLPGQPTEGPHALAAAPTAPSSKKRSKQNLPLLIDVHADRLCIWQSTMSDDMHVLAESQQIRPAAGEAGTVSTAAQGDALKDFCVDIVVPFFSPRLPLVCDALNRKLGGPVIGPTPSSRSSKTGHASSTRTLSSDAKTSRDKAAMSASSSSSRHRSSKPGAATVRRPGSTATAAAAGAGATSSTRNLERVLSNERLRRSVSRGPNDAIAQMRSATAAPIPGLKREMSEPAALATMAHIPPLLRRGSSAASSSSSSMTAYKSKLFRERPSHDLARSASDGMAGLRGDSTGSNSNSTTDADAADSDARARKKALVEAQLQEAISALKKPNRELAGKAAVEAAEKRLFAANPVRKLKKPSRPVAATADTRVQVKATPVNNRFHDVFVSTTTTMSMSMSNTSTVMPSGTGTQHVASTATGAISFSTVSQGTTRGLSYPHQTAVAASPRVAATPVATGRQRHIDTTPVRGGGERGDRYGGTATANVLAASVPDSAVKAAASISSVEMTPSRGSAIPAATPTATSTIMSRFALARARQAAQQPDASSPAITLAVVLASSPLQARVAPRATVGDENAGMGNVLLETPTKARAPRAAPANAWPAPGGLKPAVGRADDEENRMDSIVAVAASPVAARPAMAVGNANRVQALYQQMGWDDDDDDLA